MKKSTLFDILALIIITLIAYFPVSMFMYSLKNDSLLHYLPFRYHISESIQHGYFPFWSPYLYTGFPIHADMQGMTWNPLVLLISLVTRYNMTVLEIEVVIYLVLGAIGMYSLLKSFNLHRIICVVGGISYMSCGFMNGSASVIPWISSAAFVPFVFLFFKRLLENVNLRNAILFGSSLSLLFLCGYPTFFIFTCYVLFAISVFSLIVNYRKKTVPLNIKTILIFFTAILVFLLLCAPAIISYVEFLPYYSRGSGITAAKAAENPFTLFASLSFILPNGVHKDHPMLNTDPSMRNHYVGLFVFLLFCYSLFLKKNTWQKLILGITIISFLVSLGAATPLHKLLYSFLPLFDTFRHPANIRLFPSIGIILLAAFCAQQIISTSNLQSRKILIRICLFVAAVLLGILLITLLLDPGALKNIAAATKIFDPKQLVDSLTFSSMLVITAVFQLVFVTILIFALRKQQWHQNLVAVLFTANSVVFCWIALPFTFVSQIKTKQVNEYINSYPDGYPIPDLKVSVEANIISDSIVIPPEGYPNFYSKKITIQDHITTPSLNHAYEKFNADKKLRWLLKDYPLAWLNDTIFHKTVPETWPANRKFSIYTGRGIFEKQYPNNRKLSLITFEPNRFVFKIGPETPAVDSASRQYSPTVLSIFQQYNHNWRARVNGYETPIYKMNLAFMGIPVPAGESLVELTYKPRNIIAAVWVSLISILLLMVYLIYSSITTKKP